MTKLFSIVLIVLGFTSVINGLSLISTNLFMAAVNILAALILLYVGFNIFKNTRKNKTENKK